MFHVVSTIVIIVITVIIVIPVIIFGKVDMMMYITFVFKIHTNLSSI